MKASILPILRPFAALLLAVLLAGCDEEQIKAAQAKGKTLPTKTAPQPPPVVTNAAPASAPVLNEAPTNAGVLAAAPVVTNAPVPPPPPSPSASTNGEPVILKKMPAARIPLPPLADEVVTMAEASVEESVLLAYVERATAPFELGVQEILYLNDLGIPAQVVAALVRKSGPQAEQALAAVNDGSAAAPVVPAPAVASVPAANPQAAPPPQATLAPQAVPTAELVPSAAPPPPATPPVVVQQGGTVNNAYYFQESLSPYGTWVEIAPYGWCWQPTVAVVDVGWRPYCHRGRWIWSDCGWYWQSDYSWGWAPFHYGRWHHHSRRGWFWIPDTVWGPSWVSWRYTDSHCGWAPLPPEARFSVGVGFSYHNARVGIGFDFGLDRERYVFVGYDRFHDRHPYRHLVPRERHQAVFTKTTVINNYVVANNTTIVNHGVGRERVAAITRTEIRKVSIQDAAPSPSREIRSDRLSSDGSRLAVYRPRFEQRGAAPAPGSTPNPGREEALKPRSNGDRTVWSPAGSGGSIGTPIRPRGGAVAAPAVAPAPAPSGGANAGKRPESGRTDTVPQAGVREPARREATPAPAVQPRAVKPQPALSPKAQESRAPAIAPAPTPARTPSTPRSDQRPSIQAPPTVPAPTTPGRFQEPAKPSRETRQVTPLPSSTPAPQPRLTPGVQRPLPPAPSTTISPGSFSQPAPSSTVIGRPQVPRQEAPKPQIQYSAPSSGQGGGASPSNPSIRTESRGGGFNSPQNSRPAPSYTPSAPVPSRVAPAAPSSAPSPGAGRPAQGSGSSSERGRKSDVN